MQYLKFTHVDAVTGVSVLKAPAANGPRHPAVDGLQFVWARESQYPTQIPEFFGTCPDASATDVDGVLGLFNQADWDVMHADELSARPKISSVQEKMVTAIKAERDYRKFNGVKIGTQWIHTDTYSRTQWMAMVMMGASVPPIDWTTMDGTSVTTSQALAGQVFQGTAQLDAALFGHAKTLIAQVEAAANPALVDITTGWPATFEPAL